MNTTLDELLSPKNPSWVIGGITAILSDGFDNCTDRERLDKIRDLIRQHTELNS